MHDDERALESFSEGSRDEEDDEQKSEVTERSESGAKDATRADGQSRGGVRGESRPRLSLMSHDTMTPRSESTFEMIDGIQAMAIGTPEIQVGSDSIPIGSFTEVSSMTPSTSKSFTFTQGERTGNSGNISSGDNDDTSAWDEVRMVDK